MCTHFSIVQVVLVILFDLIGINVTHSPYDICAFFITLLITVPIISFFNKNKKLLGKDV